MFALACVVTVFIFQLNNFKSTMLMHYLIGPHGDLGAPRNKLMCQS